MRVETLPVGPLQVNCYVCICPAIREALVIDPGADAGSILACVAEADSDVVGIVNTHGHFDHIGANREIMNATGADLMLHAADVPLLAQAGQHAALYGIEVDASPEPERTLEEGDSVVFGECRLEVLHLPGHSPGGICLVSDGVVFSGDALFAGSVGRTDLPGGDHEVLISGIRNKLLSLPDETIIYPGHGPATTVGREKLHNPFLS